MDWSTQGSSVPRNLLEFAQTHVHWVDDANQLSHPLSPPSPPALNLSQHQAGSFQKSQFFELGGRSIGVWASTSVLPMNIQYWFPLGLTGWISLQSKGLSRVFSNTTVQSISSSVLSLLYGPALTSTHDHWENYYGTLSLLHHCPFPEHFYFC